MWDQRGERKKGGERKKKSNPDLNLPRVILNMSEVLVFEL